MALLATALLAMAPAAPARDLSAVPTGSDELPNLDTRSGAVVPTAGQRALVGRLGASVRWNRFGTPESLVRYGGYLATGLSPDPVAAARAWIRDDRALFRLSQSGVDRLEVLALSPMVGSPGYAVVFRQRFGSLPAGVDGLISVGVTRGRIAYVSSTAAGDGNVPTAPTLSATDAWRRAAADAGLGEPPSSSVSKPRPDGSWSVFDVRGFTLPQRARLVAVPTPVAGVKSAFEVNVIGLQGGAVRAYTTFVDARTGRMIVRYNRLDHAATEDSADTAGNPRWRFFSSFPALTYQGTDTRVTACWEAGPGCPVGLESAATRAPWDYDFTTGLPTNTTIGNAATTA
jgi:hypothetical protein